MINITHPTACICDRCKMNSIQGTTSGGVQSTGQYISTYENENERLKSLLRELLPELEKLPEEVVSNGWDFQISRDYWIKRLREAVGDERDS